MSQAVESLLMLCRCLQTSSQARPQMSSEGMPTTKEQWAAVIDLANYEWLTPALWEALEDKNTVHGFANNARVFLKEVHRLNRDRNRAIREQAMELASALNREGITPLLLKGGIYLFEENETAVATRMMVDLDILVAEDQLPSTLDVAEGLDYDVTDRDNERVHDIKCLPHSGDRAVIEIHRYLGPQRTLLPPEMVIRQATLVETDSIRLLIPSLTHRVLHNIFHAQVQNRGHALGRISLRGLHDLGLLLNSNGQEVDWPAIEDAMVSHGYGKALWSYLYAGEKLLDLPITLNEAHVQHAERHFRRSMRQIRSRRLQRMMGLLGSLSHPFSRPLVEYLYGTSKSSASLNLKRVWHACRMVRKHHYKAISKISEIRGLFYKQIK